jgi:hypothetical protein
MSGPDRRRGCGCCGCLSGFFLFLVALMVVGIGFLYFFATNNLNGAAASHPGPLPAVTYSRQTYATARQKFDRFFQNDADRSVTFSNEEVNVLLADSPELRFLMHGVVVTLNQVTAEVYCGIPVEFPMAPRRYLNCTFELRPSMRAQELELDVSRMESGGKPLGPGEVHQYRFVVVPVLEKTFGSLNKAQGTRSVREVRIENGNLVLSR